ncbi:MAG: DUF1043 family protein [Gammaproteobacteria bacterium]|nr:DUF1043 family protein [Gammaproteobacteria bacterium]
MSIWLIAIGCIAAGVVLGVVLTDNLGTTSHRVKDLENQIKTLRDSHVEYKDSVSEHFNTTAELVQKMTESYKEVYQHLASGAQDLCTTEVASKLLPASSDAAFEISNEDQESAPPKDYATKKFPNQLGALSEDFGIEKLAPRSDNK